MSTLEVNTIAPITGSSDVTLGGSSKNIKFASGTTVDFSTNSPTLTLGNDLKATPSFYAYQNSPQAIINNTWVKLSIDTEEYDSDSAYDNSSNYRFTPAVAGKYFLFASWRIDATQDGDLCGIQIYKNGSGHTNFSRAHYNRGSFTISTVATANTTDYFEVYAYQNTGAQRDTYGFGTSGGNNDIGRQTFFGAYRIIGA